MAMSALVLLLALHGPARAHELVPGAVRITQSDATTWTVATTRPQLGGRHLPLALDWAPGCTQDGVTVRCPSGDLGDHLEVPALAGSGATLRVRVEPLEGPALDTVLLPGQTRVSLRSPAAHSWLRHGLDHVAEGPDHVLFVLALSLVIGLRWRILSAVLAFTLGHSVSLALVAAGLAAPATTAVELLIALSVAMLAAEALRPERGWTTRAPEAVTLLLGGLHGLGYGSGLLAMLPDEAALLPATLGFGTGVALGHLAVAALAAALLRLAQRPRWSWLPAALAWAAGLPAGIWTVTRAVQWGAERCAPLVLLAELWDAAA